MLSFVDCSPSVHRQLVVVMGSFLSHWSESVSCRFRTLDWSITLVIVAVAVLIDQWNAVIKFYFLLLPAFVWVDYLNCHHFERLNRLKIVRHWVVAPTSGEVLSRSKNFDALQMMANYNFSQMTYQRQGMPLERKVRNNLSTVSLF